MQELCGRGKSDDQPQNIPNMISQFTKVLGDAGVNISNMTNKSKGEYAYTLIDLESAASAEALDALKAY